MSELSAGLSGLVGAHALRFDRESERAAFLAELVRSPLAGRWWVVPADGGLLADYGLLQNILLPARVGGDRTAIGRLARWRERLALAGVPPLPMSVRLSEMSAWQLRLAAFLRGLVADAPALVFDDTCYGLQAGEHELAALLHAFFRLYFPFRPSLYLTLSAPPPELNIPASNTHRHETFLA